MRRREASDQAPQYKGQAEENCLQRDTGEGPTGGTNQKPKEEASELGGVNSISAARKPAEQGSTQGATGPSEQVARGVPQTTAQGTSSAQPHSSHTQTSSRISFTKLSRNGISVFRKWYFQ